MQREILNAALETHPEGCFRLTFADGARRRVRELRLAGDAASFQLVEEVEINPGIWGISATRFAAMESIAAAEPLSEAQCRPAAKPKSAGAGRQSGEKPALPAGFLTPPYGLFGLAALALFLFAAGLISFLLAPALLRHFHGRGLRAALALAPYPIAAALAAAWAFRRRRVYRLINRFRFDPRTLLLAFLTGVGFTLALQLVQHGFHPPQASPTLAKFGIAAVVIQLAAIAPDELLERGVLLASLLAYMPAWPAMLLGAEAAALLHASPFGALPLELAAAIVYRKAGNSAPASAAFHAANAATVLMLPLLLH